LFFLTIKRKWRLVGAGRLDVAGLLALVADTLAVGFGGAVARDVADLAAWISLVYIYLSFFILARRTVVALLALRTVTRHVSVSAARVAGLLASAKATVTTAVATALRAVASNVSDLTALVAFLAARATRESASGVTTVVTAGGA
jgi:hypothetical protein